MKNIKIGNSNQLVGVQVSIFMTLFTGSLLVHFWNLFQKVNHLFYSIHLLLAL